jgi:site-specific recombinase XerD
MQFNTSIYLDKRRSKKGNSKYPVKIRVYFSLIQKAKIYPTGIDLSEKEFNLLFNSDVNIKGKNKEKKIKLQRIESIAIDVASNLHPFSFESFEKKMFRSKNASISISYHYKNKIKGLHENDQISTASNYDLSLKSINRFLDLKTRTTINNLTFYDITIDWLNKYETFMIRDSNKSHTTVSMYLRALRTVFNDAISSNDIKSETYPFGKGKYQIPTSTRKKKALSREQISILFKAEPQTQEQEMAKDFWFFSYACSGMNIKDIALLRYENLNDNTLQYYRAKTIKTKKSNLKEIKIFLNEYAQSIVKKYGNQDKGKHQFIFPILSFGDNAVEQQRKIKNFTSIINLHFNKMAKYEGFKFRVSTYWARHSFATISIQKGATMEFISEALNHSNLNVTKNYFAGFEDEAKKEFAIKLMEF